MSAFSQIFSRMFRIAQANSAADDANMDLRRAEELIEEARRRDEPRIEIPAESTKKTKADVSPEPDAERREADANPEPGGAMSYQRAIAILRVREGATMEEVASAYRKIIVEYHPDRTSHLGAEERSSAEARTRELNGAYTFLKEYLGR